MAQNETNQTTNSTNPLASSNRRPNFPTDEYTSACIIGFFFAGLRPNPKFSKDKTPVPNVKFLLAGYLRNPDGSIKTDENGEKIVVRKWTNWKAVSYGKKAGLVQLFKDIPNLEDLMCDNEEGGALWTTPFKILVEPAATEGYTNITRIKTGGNPDVLDICYNKEFVPFKVVKAYGEDVTLEEAYLKQDDGIKKYTNDQMVDPVENDNDD